MKDLRDSFLREVTDQIKAKEAKHFVLVELNYHIKEVKCRWIEKGLSESDAEIKAVEQMGSPIKLGQQLNKLHRPRIDWMMVILLITTLCIGFLPLISLGYADEEYFLKSKLIIVVLGGVTALGLMFFDYKKFAKLGWLLYTIGVFILFIMDFYPNTTINGIPYLRIGPLTIESMMVVPIFFLAWASFFHNSKLKIWHFAILFLLSFSLLIATGNITTTFIYTIMVFVMLWWSKFGRENALKITSATFLLAIIAGLMLWPSLKVYQTERILGFLNPEAHASSAGYTYLHIKELLSVAGWFGASGTKDFIPQAHTDLVFASLTYYHGWLFATCLVFILCLFLARMIVVITQVNDTYGKLLLIGGITLYFVQFTYNIGMTIGLLPITAISLPFISYGLMPVLLNSIIIGVILSVYRRKDLPSVNVGRGV